MVELTGIHANISYGGGGPETISRYECSAPSQQWLIGHRIVLFASRYTGQNLSRFFMSGIGRERIFRKSARHFLKTLRNWTRKRIEAQEGFCPVTLGISIPCWLYRKPPPIV